MGIQIEKLKKIQTDRPIPVKQGRVRGNKNILRLVRDQVGKLGMVFPHPLVGSHIGVYLPNLYCRQE